MSSREHDAGRAPPDTVDGCEPAPPSARSWRKRDAVKAPPPPTSSRRSRERDTVKVPPSRVDGREPTGAIEHEEVASTTR
jgi:hypothetical protein